MGAGGSSAAKESVKETPKRNANEGHGAPVGENTFLLLGTMGVGKSTIAKQMAISFGDGLSEGDRSVSRQAIIKNIVSSTVTVIKEAPKDTFSDDVYTSMDTMSENNDVTSADDMVLLREALLLIWKDATFVKAFDDFKPATYTNELEHNASSWFKTKLEEILSDNYSPKDEDIVKCRAMTSDVSDTPFTFNNKQFKLRDVGGQVQYRAQWKEAFLGAQCVLYIVSLDDFHKDSSNKKDDGTLCLSNRLVESRTLFKDIVNSDTMGSVPYVLIFNKADLFQETLKTKPLSVCPIFSKAEYTERCQRYICKYFSKVVDDIQDTNGKERNIHGSTDSIVSVNSYFTCATDTELFKAVMEKSLIAIWKIMEARLSKAGF